MRAPLQVRAYSGYRGQERPQAFVKDGRRVEVERILGQWQEPDARVFRVRGSDGVTYVLCCARRDLTWFLETSR